MEPLPQRWKNYIGLLDEIPEGKLPPEVQKNLVPYVSLTVQVCMASSGWFAFIFRWIWRIYNALPFNVTQILFGGALCYFGGTFTISIAAAEAFRTMGYEDAKRNVQELMIELKPVFEANDADDLVDDDGDGISDVDQISPPELLKRKIMLLVFNLKSPHKIQDAVKSIYAALLAVLATLKLEFAQTTAIAMGIADMVQKPIVKFADADDGKIKEILPKQAHQWIVPTIDSIFRIAAIMVALYVSRIISSFYAALRGGKLVAEGIVNILVEKAKIGIVLCPGMIDASFDPDDSMLDEVLGWLVAVQGFVYQIQNGYQLMPPWDLILFPLKLIEDLLTVYVTASAVVDGKGDGDAARRLAELDNGFMCLPVEYENATLVGWNATLGEMSSCNLLMDTASW